MNRRHFLQRAVAALVALPWIAACLPRKHCGHVAWCYYPPVDISWQVHKFSLLDAFETAKNFIYYAGRSGGETTYRLGDNMARIMVVLPHFEPVERWTSATLPSDRRVFLGMMGQNRVVLDPALGIDEGVIENGRYYVTAQIVYPVLSGATIRGITHLDAGSKEPEEVVAYVGRWKQALRRYAGKA